MSDELGEMTAYAGDRAVVWHENCLTALALLPDNYVDSIVTDPPYGLGFMGKEWDALPPGEAWARECLRVLKPGGYLVAFGGSRTWHRLAVAVEDGGFEIRDSIAWLYGSGFPKAKGQLKPAFEPVIVARKPFRGSEAANVLRHGTGALNIDACRISATDKAKFPEGYSKAMGDAYAQDAYSKNWTAGADGDPSSRWPTNVVLDESQAAELDNQTGILTSGANPTKRSSDKFRETYGDFKGQEECTPARGADSGGASRFFPVFRYQAKAPAKERPKNADGKGHPTVKPLEFMRWLVRLVTPPGGCVLDTFAGSGTTGEAALLEGFTCLLIEKEADYLPLIQQRLERVPGEDAA